MYSIETHNLCRQFGKFEAVKSLNLQVPEGTFFGFLGPNGAGKSTTIKMLTGLLKPSQGQVKVLGYDLWKHPVEVKRQIGVVPEKLSLFERLTGPEYLEFVGAMHGMSKPMIKSRTDELLELMQLQDKRTVLMADYSHGMKKKVALAAALIHNPKLLFLDEPFEGVDAVSAKALRQLLESLLHNNVTIFLTSHILEIVEKLCDQLAVIHQGRLISSGPLEDILLRMYGEKPAGTASLEDAFIELVGQEYPQKNLSWIQ